MMLHRQEPALVVRLPRTRSPEGRSRDQATAQDTTVSPIAAFLGDRLPTMTVVGAAALGAPEMLVEVEVTAAP